MSDVIQYLSVGGPVGVILVIGGFLLNAYTAKRKDDREEVTSDRQSESGIVETTKTAIALVRSELVAKDTAMVQQREAYRAELERLNREHRKESREQDIEISSLQNIVSEQRKEISQLRGWR